MTIALLPLRGMHFRPPAKAILACLPANCPLQLIPEPENPYDPQAVKVQVRSGDIPPSLHSDLSEMANGMGYTIEGILAEPEWHLGYIGKEATAQCVGISEGKLSFGFDGKPCVRIEREDKA